MARAEQHKWVAIYINCTSGKFFPVGVFDSEAEANEFCETQHDPALWSSFALEERRFVFDTNLFR